jgi:hypothetical protein
MEDFVRLFGCLPLVIRHENSAIPGRRETARAVHEPAGMLTVETNPDDGA